MEINLKFDTSQDRKEDILELVMKILGREDVENEKIVSINDARKSLRELAKLGKVQLAQDLVNKYCGGSIEGSTEDSYNKLVQEIEKIINKGE
ncbi:Uncharacterised protein [[Clostridium] sordellii]|uniref:hypothetical protein n=1 Tax=Paraclostridium sordellii TaxID=1505 RepID=UPI0005DB8ACC|nr:hypothetical protein [Paeniclostridium sordellii]CEP94211.1 Uncharacterised protein [[Clostridium] sordellii] [Paeniclostridium sordellii]